MSYNGFIFFYDWAPIFRYMTADECKILLLAMIDFAENGKEFPSFKSKKYSIAAKIGVEIIYNSMKRSKKNSENGEKSAAVSNEKRKKAPEQGQIP